MKKRGRITPFRYSFSFSLFVFMLALFFSFWGTALHAETFIVSNTNDSGLNSLREAISDANDNDEVDLITLNITGMITLSSQLRITSGMTIQGPGSEDLAISGQDTCRVFFIDTVESVEISDLSIVNGFALNSAGGGIYNMADNLTVTDCIFDSNSATMDGGGMYNEDCDPTITNCNFSVNSADNDGGGMYNYRSSPVIINCIFAGNIGDNAGGGIYNISSSPAITNCIFTSNEVTNHGGGMYNSGSDPVLTSCDFTSNSATNGGGMANYNESDPILTECDFMNNVASSLGGAIWISNFSGDDSIPVFSGCTFSGNTAPQGGAIRSYSSSPEVNNCTFSLNSADYGGGMYNSVSSPDVSNCTFDGNIADVSGGGMCSRQSDLSVINSTFIGNTASDSGGGMCNGIVDDMSSSVSGEVVNCTFTGNTADYGGGMYNIWSSTIVTNCIFWDNSENEIQNGTTDLTLSYCVIQSDGVVGYPDISSNDIITADPMLEALADNGGPTWTCALGEGSSAIDGGTDEGNIPDTDQRGVARPQGAGYDIGAFEVEQASSSGGGCNISTIPVFGFLLFVPVLFLLKRGK